MARLMIGSQAAVLLGVAHVAAGLAVVIDSSAINTVPLALLRDAVGVWAASVALIGCGLLSIAGAGMGRRIMLIPQQILLLGHIVSIAVAVLTGRYADGYSPDGGTFFIFADQVFLLLLSGWGMFSFFIDSSRGLRDG